MDAVKTFLSILTHSKAVHLHTCKWRKLSGQKQSKYSKSTEENTEGCGHVTRSLISQPLTSARLDLQSRKCTNSKSSAPRGLNGLLPEWLEGEKASPHHADEVAAGCDHCARTVHIAPGFVPSGVHTITFASSPERRVLSAESVAQNGKRGTCEGGSSASAAGWFSFRFLRGNVNGKAAVPSVSPVLELPSGGGEVNSSTARRALLDPLEHTDHDITRRARRKSATQRLRTESRNKETRYVHAALQLYKWYILLR